MTLDLDKAVAANAKLLGLDKLPVNTQRRIAALLADYQEEVGIAPDGAYDRATEQALNLLVERRAGLQLGPPAPLLPGLDGFTNLEVVSRLRPWIGAKLNIGRYVLGAGAKYDQASPFGPIPDWLAKRSGFPVGTPACDCSGMVHWGSGTVRGNYNTDGMVADVWRLVYGRPDFTRPGPRKLYEPVEPDDVRIGDILVYPGPDEDQDGDRDTPGHTGIASYVAPGTVWGEGEFWNRVKAIHCSSRDQKTLGAIRETWANLWWDAKRSLVIRCKRVRYS